MDIINNILNAGILIILIYIAVFLYSIFIYNNLHWLYSARNKKYTK